MQFLSVSTFTELFRTDTTVFVKMLRALRKKSEPEKARVLIPPSSNSQDSLIGSLISPVDLKGMLGWGGGHFRFLSNSTLPNSSPSLWAVLMLS